MPFSRQAPLYPVFLQQRDNPQMSALPSMLVIQSCLTLWDLTQTGEQLYQRSSRTVGKFLGPKTDLPTWWSGKGTEKPQGIWLWRPVELDYRASTGLGKQTLGGHKQIFVSTRTQEKEAVTPQETEQTCLECPGVSVGGMGWQWTAVGSETLNTIVLA